MESQRVAFDNAHSNWVAKISWIFVNLLGCLIFGYWLVVGSRASPSFTLLYDLLKACCFKFT